MEPGIRLVTSRIPLQLQGQYGASSIADLFKIDHGSRFMEAKALTTPRRLRAARTRAFQLGIRVHRSLVNVFLNLTGRVNPMLPSVPLVLAPLERSPLREPSAQTAVPETATVPPRWQAV